MDKKAVETKAVNAVRDIIVESEYLDQFIADNDKEPSFDGFVYVYSKPGKKKIDSVGRVAIQVKGTQKKVEPNANEIKHSVDISDLRAYLNEGGVFYFVIHIPPDGKEKKIFYEDFLPIKIRRILDSADCQTTITLKFKPFPNDATQLRGLFYAFLEHKRKQAILHDLKEIPRIDDLQRGGQLSKITLTTAGSRMYDNPIKALLNDDVYVYATVNGSAAHHPVDLVYNTIERYIVHDVENTVSIKGKEYYSKYTVRESNDKKTYKFGESVILTIHHNDSTHSMLKVTLDYKPCNSMRQRVIDLAFYLSLFESEGIEIDGHLFRFSIASKPSLEGGKKELEYWGKAIQALNVLHVTEDIDIKSMSDSDYQELNTLISAFVDNQLISNVRKNLPFIYVISICNIKIVLTHSERNEPDNMSRISDFFASYFMLGFTLSDESSLPQHFVPPCAMFDSATWGAISNIHYEDIVPSFMRMFRQNNDVHIFTVANNTLLSILLAYDTTKKSPLLVLAQQLAKWLLDDCDDEHLNKYILVLNYLQAIKRCRDLSKDERRQLLEITEGSTAEKHIKIAAYILLENIEAADLHFDQLDPEMKKTFANGPFTIYGMGEQHRVTINRH